MHGIHSRLCLSLSTIGAGGLIAQFYSSLAFSRRVTLIQGGRGEGGKYHSVTYSAYRCRAPTASCNHVASTASRLGNVGGSWCRPQLGVFLHVVPVACACPISEGALAVDWQRLVGAVQRVREHRAAVLEERVVDGTTRPREVVNGVQIEPAGDSHDNAVQGNNDSLMCKLVISVSSWAVWNALQVRLCCFMQSCFCRQMQASVHILPAEQSMILRR